MEELEKIIGENLIYLRKSAGLTQLELGEKFNYSDKTVSKWEQGSVVPSVEVLKQIADFYGVTVDFILSKHTFAEFKSKLNKSPDSMRKVTLISLAITALWLIAVTIYVAMCANLKTADPSINRWWNVFIWCVPFSALIASLGFRRFFRDMKMNIILTSIFAWGILVAAFISFLDRGIYWYLFFIGIPLQAGIILLARLRK